jgi:hypothetical protein
VAALAIAAAGAGPAAAQSASGGFEDGLPFWVWVALPQIFPEYVPGPGGYLSFGFEWQRGDQLPVGLSRTDDRIPVIQSASGPAGREGAPPNLDAYRRFLVSAAEDPRFTADNILPVIRYYVRLSWMDRLRYRYLAIPRARDAMARLGNG